MPANQMRGEAPLGEHKLIVDFNRFCVLEGVMGQKTPELIASFKVGVDFGFSELRSYVRVFLDRAMTDEEVGNLIGSLGQTDVPIPKELRKKDDPETQSVWVASLALDEAINGFLAPQKEKKENPPLAA